jgi:iron complex outermembrane receptor protein
MSKSTVLLLAAIGLAAIAPRARADAASDQASLLNLSLEQLGDVKVTATSRRATPLSDTPASVYVIQGDDLRALGIRTLPEALRLAPNLQVAQINSAGYAVSARGMKTSLSDKLLVMIDGRPIYTPLFAGVLWDQQRVLVEDIERIEVVSGPGAAAWGANAVNGVINIVMRPARDTSGGFAKGWAAADGHGVAAAQTIAAGSDGAIRLYAARDQHDGSETADGMDIPDDWTQDQGGFRGNWRKGADTYSLEGDAFTARSAPRGFGPVEVQGHNVVGRWSRELSPDDRWSLQAFYDYVHRLDPTVIDDRMAIADVEFVQDKRAGAHQFTWGLGYRQARDDSRPGALARLVPDDRTLRWANVFVQDQFAISGRLTANFGLRLDSNSYTGVEVLPTARFSWRQDGGALIWGALSRAVRSPARFDRDFFFPANEPYFIRGGPDFQSEVSNVAEVGYRAQPTDWMSFSLTAFHHWHNRLRGGTPAPQGGVYVANTVQGRTWGAEGWATLRMPGQWEIAAGFLELREHFELMDGGGDSPAIADQGNDPEHQYLLRATRRIGTRQQLSAFARYVSALPSPAIPGYVQLDARWSFSPTPTTEIGVGARNLLDHRHAELQPSDGLQPSDFGRVAYVDITVGW